MRSSYIIVIPDVHGRTFWRDAVKGRETDRIIFLGDYFDPYGYEGITHDDAFREFKDILAFKKDHMNNVTLLLGNHDLGYLDRGVCECRMDYVNEAEIRRLLLENLQLFDLVCIETGWIDRFLFSHAGVRSGWVRNNRWLFGGNMNLENVNALLHDDSARPNLLSALSDSSHFRGGRDSSGSLVWADVREFDYLPGYIHIFGHTQLENDPYEIEDHGWCVDCREGFALTPMGNINRLP